MNNDNKSYLICDIGNAYIKAIHNNNRTTFPARLTNTSHLNKVNVLSYNEKEYVIGSGLYNIKTEKIDRPEILSYILASAAKCSNSNNIILDYLVLALPLGQYKLFSEKLKLSLESKMKHDFKFNNRDITLEYKNIIILPEAISAFYGIRDKIKDLSSNDTLIIDVGGGTIDIVLIDSDGVSSKPKTLNLGSIKILQHVSTYLEENFTGIGVVHLEKVQHYLHNGFTYNGDTHSLNDALSYAQEDIDYIIQQLNSYYSTELKTSNVVVIDTLGILYRTLEKEFKNSNMIHINDSFSNAYGMEIMIKNILGIN